MAEYRSSRFKDFLNILKKRRKGVTLKIKSSFSKLGQKIKIPFVKTKNFFKKPTVKKVARVSLVFDIIGGILLLSFGIGSIVSLSRTNNKVDSVKEDLSSLKTSYISLLTSLYGDNENFNNDKQDIEKYILSLDSVEEFNSFKVDISEVLSGVYSSPIMHSNIYRGKYLGTSFTSEQKFNISSGTFQDLYVGDYWVIDNVRYRIADIDYFYHYGDLYPLLRHHLVIVPDTPLYSSAMNGTNSTDGGYVMSDMHTSYLSIAISKISIAFPDSSLITHREYLSMLSSGVWTNIGVALMNEFMVFGSNLHSTDYEASLKKQFSLFRLNSEMLFTSSDFWLRDVVSSDMYSYVYRGRCSSQLCTKQSGVRPYFCIG